jgi:hypothetical protein
MVVDRVDAELAGQLERPADVVDRARRDAGRAEQRRPLGAVAGGELLLDQRPQGGAVGDPLAVGRKARVGGQLRGTDRLGERRELAVVAGADHQLAVGGAVGGERLDARVDVAEPLGERAAAEPAGRLVGERCERGVQQVDRHALPGAGAVALAQRGEHRGRRVEAGDHVDQRDAGLARRVGRPGDAHQPAERLDERVVARQVAPALLAEARDLAVDDARVALCGLLVAEPEALQGAGLEVRHDDVGTFAEPARQLVVAAVAQVERQRALVAVGGVVVGRPAGGVERRAPGAGVVARWRLDLDDLGT